MKGLKSLFDCCLADCLPVVYVLSVNAKLSLCASLDFDERQTEVVTN